MNCLHSTYMQYVLARGAAAATPKGKGEPPHTDTDDTPPVYARTAERRRPYIIHIGCPEPTFANALACSSWADPRDRSGLPIPIPCTFHLLRGIPHSAAFISISLLG
jgi:hypothetical protein